MKKSLLFRNGDSSFCKIYLLVCLLLVGFINLNAQEAPNKKVSLDLKNVPLIDVLLDIQKQTGVNFAYEKTQVEQFKPVTISIKGATVEEVLKIILKDTGFTYKITGNNIAIVKQQETSTVKLIQVSGKVTDEKGNSIPGATVIIHGTTQGVATDVDGRYTLAVKPDDVLRVSFVGYKICNFITYWFTVTYNVYQRAVLNLVSFWYHYITFVIISLNFISYIFLLYF